MARSSSSVSFALGYMTAAPIARTSLVVGAYLCITIGAFSLVFSLAAFPVWSLLREHPFCVGYILLSFMPASAFFSPRSGRARILFYLAMAVVEVFVISVCAWSVFFVHF